MSTPPADRGFTLVETLATCAVAALAVALGASLLSGAGDPLPRAKETLLEGYAIARLAAMSDGPATLELRDGQLRVLDGRGATMSQRDWPTQVRATVLESGLTFDRLGQAPRTTVLLRYGPRTLEIVP